MHKISQGFISKLHTWYGNRYVTPYVKLDWKKKNFNKSKERKEKKLGSKI